MAWAYTVFVGDRREARAAGDLVEHGADPADSEAEDQALDIEARAQSEIERDRWRSVFRNEQRLGQPERHRDKTDTDHRTAVTPETHEEHQPWQEKGDRPP
jgi:hypothetical protein